ncbi:hypothetical protein ILP97_25980 [Amycolatopsis sp. H6(2020)]|nr:hypothetical protein [Amycolatopsis sp. H6(2020)]
MRGNRPSGRVSARGALRRCSGSRRRATRRPWVGTVLREVVDNPGGLRLTEMQMIAFTSFCNVTGLPAISLPVHTSSGGLPIGAQLVAGPWEEAVLIRLASALEPVVGWTRRYPALG